MNLQVKINPSASSKYKNEATIVHIRAMSILFYLFTTIFSVDKQHKIIIVTYKQVILLYKTQIIPDILLKINNLYKSK